MELFMMVLQNLPIIDLVGDLIGGSAPETTGGLIYDVSQFLGGLLAVAKIGSWMAERTAWEWDDGLFKWFVSSIPRAIAWLADLSAGNTRGK